MPYNPNVDYRQVARRAAASVGLDPNIFERQIGVESIGYRPDVITGRTASPAGAQGIAQFMPSTAQSLGVNPLHPTDALYAAAKLMAGYVKQYGGYRNALVAYNAGPGRVGRPLLPETANYVSQILHGQNPSGGIIPPHGTGTSRVGVNGGGGPQTVSVPGVSLNPADTSALQAAIAGQQSTTPQPYPASAPYVMGTGGDKYLRGQGGYVPGAAPMQSTNGTLNGALQALGAPSPQLSVGGATATVPNSGGSQSTGGIRGRTLVLGDSLEVGTFPLLRQRLGNQVAGVFSGGKPSSWGINQLRQQFQSGKYQNVVFDMGTNDATAGQLRQSLQQLSKIAQGAHVYVSTVNTPFEQDAKNNLIHQFAASHPNVTVIPWHGISNGGANLPDHIHGDYGARATAIEQALGVSQQGGGSGPSHVAAGFLPSGAKYVPGRADQGRDGTTDPGGAIIAPGAGRVIRVGSDPGGFGPSYPIVQFTSGPFAGRTIYIGHTFSKLPAGATFKAGAVLSRTGTHGVGNATVPGWFEIGFAPGGSPGKWGQPTPFR